MLFLLTNGLVQGGDATLSIRPFAASTRNLLKSGGATQSLKAIRENRVTTQPTTLRILAIRVDFQEDGNRLTTGNGKFLLQADPELTIDTPPHDLTYFEHQLLALRNYFRTVSNGNLILEADVFPGETTGSYTVSQQMSHYAPAGDEDLLDRRLAELFQEGFQVADAAGEIDFSQYDIFVIFHAGVGADFSFDFDATPQDVPSVFLSLDELRRQLGEEDPSYRGISVNGGATHIPDGILLPEMQSQEGFEIALLGTMTIMFGSQIGLPILFNPENGRAGIGVFGLMDQGSGNFQGLIPAEPCAWSKVYLGWETPIEVRNGLDLPVAAARATNPNRIYKIPINANEYFLIENRNRDIDNDNIATGTGATGARVEFHWDDQGQRVVADALPGVITQVSEYDFGLPGSGILIWHIDENVIRENFAANRVNADPMRRGVDLEEADGAQDLGQFYGFLSPGAGSENGVIEDMFWGSNEINMLVNNDAEVVEFTPFTRPDSRANSGANSHVYVTDFSEPDSVMRFSVRNDLSQDGYPVSLSGMRAGMNSAIVSDLDGDGAHEIIFAASQSADQQAGAVFAFQTDGSPFLSSPVFAQPSGTRSFSAAVAPLENSNFVVVATDEQVLAYQPEDINGDGLADARFTYTLQSSVTTPPLITTAGISENFRVVVGASNGHVLALTDNGQEAWSSAVSTGEIAGLALMPDGAIAFTSRTGDIGVLTPDGATAWHNATSSQVNIAPAIAALSDDNALQVIVMSADGRLYVFSQNGDTETGFPVRTDFANSSQLAVADLDADQFNEVVFLSGRLLVALSHVGVLENGFPITLDSGPADGSAFAREGVSPVIADLDGDGNSDVVVSTDLNRIDAITRQGELLPAFPLSTGDALNSTPTIVDLDDDGDTELIAVAEDQTLYVWDLETTFRPDDVLWAGFLNNGRHTNANLRSLGAPPEDGDRLMPANLVYNYPNPTRGDETTIRYRLNETASIRIKIYDLAGEFVDELVGPGFAQSDNEVTWRLDDIESGVYLARVEAQGQQSQDVAIIKIAVVK